jgi:hypothetical protein
MTAKRKPAWSARPYERMSEELQAMAFELDAWAVDDTTAEQCARLRQIADSLRASAQEIVETLGGVP